MKRITITALLLCLFTTFIYAQAPDFHWAKQAQGQNSVIGNASGTDNAGNSYVTGTFSNSATFGSTVLTSNGSEDIFIAKYDASGNVLWAKKGGGVSGDFGTGIVVDGDGNSYLTGYFQGGATFGSTILTCNGTYDFFITKYDASGNVLWTKKGGGTYSFGDSIAVDISGNIYVSGIFESSATFGSTVLTSSGGYDFFIAKYDASGNVLWAKKGGGTSTDRGNGIAVDGIGNSYVTGSFAASATIGTTVLTSSGSADVFIAKYDASGNVLWAKKGGGTGPDIGNGIAVDSSGNSYVTGYFNVDATFGSTLLTSSGGSDVFIAKYDASGNVSWIKKSGGTGSEVGLDIALDGLGNSYVTGHFSDTTAFGSTVLSSSGLADVLIAKYDASGNVVWAKKDGGPNFDLGLGIAVDGSGNSYVTGYFYDSSITFGSTVLSTSGTEMFIAKINALASDANLSNLVLSSGILTPAFTSATINYTATVSNATNSITVTPTALCIQHTCSLQMRIMMDLEREILLWCVL